MKGFVIAALAIIGTVLAAVLYSKNYDIDNSLFLLNNHRRLGLLPHAKFRDPKIITPKLLNRRPRLAIVTYGILDHDKPRQHYKGVPAEVSLDYSISSLSRFVIEPARKQGYEVDVFVHSWDVAQKDTIIKLYNPTAHLIEEEVKGREGMFRSIEAGLRLRKEYEEKHDISYDWVYTVRHDTVFRNDFELETLNPNLFYVANWCKDNRDETTSSLTSAGLLLCHTLNVYPHDIKDGVPDFWFLANSANMDKVFMNFEKDFEAGVFEPTESCCNHAKLGGRLFGMHDRGELQIGRYKAHRYDFELYRWRDPEVEWIAELGLNWKETNEAYDVMESQRNSVCAGTHCALRNIKGHK